jgi:hypothetical protein
MRIAAIALISFVSVLNAGVILEVSEGTGPGGTPSPHSITALPYGLELVLTGVGSDNGCLDAGGSNPSCWYQNNTGFDWPELVITVSEPQDITCGGDVFGNCQPSPTQVRFSVGVIRNGDEFHLLPSGWNEGTQLTINAVPEPASLMPVAAGLGMFVVRVIRKRRQPSV